MFNSPKLTEFQKTLESATAQRDENARQAATLEARPTSWLNLFERANRRLIKETQKSSLDKSCSNMIGTFVS